MPQELKYTSVYFSVEPIEIKPLDIKLINISGKYRNNLI